MSRVSGSAHDQSWGGGQENVVKMRIRVRVVCACAHAHEGGRKSRHERWIEGEKRDRVSENQWGEGEGGNTKKKDEIKTAIGDAHLVHRGRISS